MWAVECNLGALAIAQRGARLRCLPCGVQLRRQGAGQLGRRSRVDNGALGGIVGADTDNKVSRPVEPLVPGLLFSQGAHPCVFGPRVPSAKVSIPRVRLP